MKWCVPTEEERALLREKGLPDKGVAVSRSESFLMVLEHKTRQETSICLYDPAAPPLDLGNRRDGREEYIRHSEAYNEQRKRRAEQEGLAW